MYWPVVTCPELFGGREGYKPKEINKINTYIKLSKINTEDYKKSKKNILGKRKNGINMRYSSQWKDTCETCTEAHTYKNISQ